ncbi:transmembrane adaptor Erv26-domain-containing protein [Chytridium lagenaria]|nr:transmembrane adaptor Erv26-domain-containing protein [Chytridium lagenaria]
MTFLSLLGYVGAILGFCFVTLCLASGLYYLAELVEEYTVLTKKVIRYTTFLMLSRSSLVATSSSSFSTASPSSASSFSLACQGVYFLMLQDFPNIQLTNPTFLGSCVLVITNHFLWFFWFTENHYRFRDIATFFGLMIWLVPFMYFISLSANEYTLPSFDPNTPSRTTTSRPKKTNLVKGILNMVLGKKDDLFPASASPVPVPSSPSYAGPGVGYGGPPSASSSSYSRKHF